MMYMTRLIVACLIGSHDARRHIVYVESDVRKRNIANVANIAIDALSKRLWMQWKPSFMQSIDNVCLFLVHRNRMFGDLWNEILHASITRLRASYTGYRDDMCTLSFNVLWCYVVMRSVPTTTGHANRGVFAIAQNLHCIAECLPVWPIADCLVVCWLLF